MNLFARAWSAIKSLAVKATGGKSTVVRGADPRLYLAGAAPGLWASNHLAEANQCKGWQFVAIRALAKMCSQAELTVHEVGNTGEKARRIKRALRLARICGDRRAARKWRRKLKRLYVHERSSCGAHAKWGTTKRHDDGGDASEPGTPSTQKESVGSEHPLLRLLQRPNPEWSLSTYLFAAAQQLELTGSVLVWRVRNEMGVTKELYVLPTGLTTPRGPSAAYPRGSFYLAPLSAYGLVNPNGEWSAGTMGQALLTGAEIDARDVKAIRWPHPIYLSDGLSPLAAASTWIDVSNQMDMSNFSLLVNGERPGMVFEQDPNIDPDPADVTQFREDLKSDSSGTPNTGKHLLMPKGLKGTPRSSQPVEMDYSNGRKDYRDAGLALHAMSPISCGITEAGSYGAFWAAIKQTTELGIQPILDLIAGEMTELLGGDYDGPRCEIGLKARKIDDPQLAQQEAKLKEDRLRTFIQAGNAVRVDEFRTMCGLAVMGGEEGQQFVGIKTTVKARDEDPDKPGVQNEDSDSDRGDRTSDDDGTGVREGHRDAPPGRPDGNGKSLKVDKVFDESKVDRDEGGKFGTGGGGGKEDDAEGAGGAEGEEGAEGAEGGEKESGQQGKKRDKEDAAVARHRDREDAARDSKREKEDAEIEKAAAAVSKKRDKEDAAILKDRDRLQAARDEEDEDTAEDREKEDSKIERVREKEDEKTEAAADKLAASCKKEDSKIARARDKEDAKIQDDRDDKDDAMYAEHRAGGKPSPERDAIWRQKVATRQAEVEAEDDALAAARQEEDEALENARHEEDGVIDDEVAARASAREAEDGTRQSERAKEDADLADERASEDAEQEDAEGELAATRQDEYDEAQDAASELSDARDAEDEATTAKRDAEDEERQRIRGEEGDPDDDDEGEDVNKALASLIQTQELLVRLMLKEFDEDKHSRAGNGKFGSGGGGKKDDKKPGKKGDKDKGESEGKKKPKASRGEMTGARREGEGKEAKVVLSDGKPAPDHITPAMVGADWTDVKVSVDPKSDVLVTGRDRKGQAKTVYSDTFHMKQAAEKFARTRDGLVEGRKMHSQVQSDRKDDRLTPQADCCWLMMEQGTRPGSESDNKGTSKLFGQKLAKGDVEIDGDRVTLTVKGERVPIKDKKARAEIKRRVENDLPLHDSTFWLKSHGATTLEGRHVVERDGHVFLEFMGKESVWHSHKVRSHELASMLMDRKETAGERGSLFGTNYDKVTKYAKTLDGGKFTPKDFRTQRATSLATEEIARMEKPRDEKSRKAAIKVVAEKVSHVLGNEPAQALASYIAPEVFSVWEPHG